MADFVAYVAAQLREKLAQDDSQAQIDSMARAALVRRLPVVTFGRWRLPSVAGAWYCHKLRRRVERWPVELNF